MRMALGRRGGVEDGLWVPTTELPRSPGHPFYERVNRVLEEAGFDRFVEERCQPHYAAVQGRPSIPPGTYFRMLMVGYFEGIDSQRGIAWRCSDSLALREFLGLGMAEGAPDPSVAPQTQGRCYVDRNSHFFNGLLAGGLRREATLPQQRGLHIACVHPASDPAKHPEVDGDACNQRRTLQVELIVNEAERDDPWQG